MWEIAENAELTRELDPEPARKKRGRPKKEKVNQSDSVSPKIGRGHKGGVRQAARELGVSQPAARRALKVASLTEEAKETAREIGLDDNRTALLKAAEQPKLKKSAERFRTKKVASRAGARCAR